MPVVTDPSEDDPGRKPRFRFAAVAAPLAVATVLFWTPLLRDVELSVGNLSLAGAWRVRPSPAIQGTSLAAGLAEYCPPGITPFWHSRKAWGCGIRLARLRSAVTYYEDPL
jgi:hypothetical protein